ncbi:hypothetical protein [Phytomonospora endophytica]|uniref:Uncharacterized protein n=1 Tax=Phytomonospora endophytica TaxID=714109 RepID=A0A841FY06_9ACTN|nr:hypothetical protein [Phytomonospora endophytica]MBB6036850.1 hypothetical protein [Phytomonospora endophytica]GIG68116.1 hypothetical protein Pen01_44110 [Phytomonospora endophytica]
MSTQQHRQSMAIVFDSSGMRPEDDGESWYDPSTGDVVSLQVNEGPPFEAAWMSDVASLRRGFARMFAGAGCLIEAELVPFGGARAVYQLVKVPLPNAPSGLVYLSIFTLTKATRYAQLIFQGAERGTTGMREAILSVRLGNPADFRLPHPYDRELRTRLPLLRSDDAGFDAQFPDHPLSRARRWAARIAPSAVVDPAFTALPELSSH